MLTDKDNGIINIFSKYTDIDFGIGIDIGSILCTKIGIEGENNSDLFWIGNAVNKSTVLSDKAKLPNAIYVSSKVYSKLTSELLYKGSKPKINIWGSSTINYNREDEICYYTKYY